MPTVELAQLEEWILMPFDEDDAQRQLQLARQRERLGRAITAIRTERGLKRNDLRDRTGLSYPYIAELEKGAKSPSAKALQAIADALGVTIVEIHVRAENLPDLGDEVGLRPPARPTGADGEVGSSTQQPRPFGTSASETEEVVNRVAERVRARVEDDVRRQLEWMIPVLVKEELDRLRAAR